MPVHIGGKSRRAGVRRNLLALGAAVSLAVGGARAAPPGIARDELPAAAAVRCEFSRETPAFAMDSGLMAQLSPNASAGQTLLACSVSDGEYRTAQAPGGVTVIPHCHNSRYLFARGNNGHLYRSPDGQAWEDVGALPIHWMFSLSNDTLLRTHYQADNHLAIELSLDDGQTWQTAQWEGGGPFAMLAENAWVLPFGFCQAPHGTVVIAEYNLPANGRYLYRSTDGGATWRMVHDNQNLVKHHHAVAYHAALQRWIAVTGDGVTQQTLLASDDDGATWTTYSPPGAIYEQPTSLLDFGDATRLLCGSDTTWQAAALDVSDGPNARRLEPLVTNWSPLNGQNYSFCVFQHDGLTYACNYDYSGGPRNAVISVSPDLVHWAVYHRFSNNERGVNHLAGALNGKLHLMVVEANESYRHMVLSPARVALASAIRIDPPTANMLSAERSSAESLAGWQDIGPAGGTLELAEGAALHGNKCAHYWRSDTQAMKLASPTAPLVANTAYAGRFWIRGDGGLAFARWRMNGFDVGTAVEFTVSPDRWREVVLFPFLGAGAGGTLGISITLVSTTDARCDALIDGLQIESPPGSSWQLGDMPRGESRCKASLAHGGAWTNVFSFETGITSNWLALDEPLPVREYTLSGDSALRISFDPVGSAFILDSTIAGADQPPLVIGGQFFLSQAQVTLAVRYASGELALSVANGRGIETAAVAIDALAASSPVQVTTGMPAVSPPLPGSIFGDAFYARYLVDAQLAAAFDDLARGTVGLGDANCDGSFDILDINAFVLAIVSLTEYEAAFPNCNINLVDFNADGWIDILDVNLFVTALSGL
ncbi:hypothetical protein RAS1_36230 [Phycisphaerae bacterium RAS1]|nr:hypothetical protein RAS1_36230 [Phycisphaerae bacterium RAS1]